MARPLFWVGCAELLIGATAISTPAAFHALQRAYVYLYPLLPLAALTIIRFVIAFGVLIAPTAMMGATLPLMIKSAEASGGRLGINIAALYASNTGGAIVGTLAAGLYLIPGVGIRATFLIACLAAGSR